MRSGSAPRAGRGETRPPSRATAFAWSAESAALVRGRWRAPERGGETGRYGEIRGRCAGPRSMAGAQREESSSCSSQRAATRAVTARRATWHKPVATPSATSGRRRAAHASRARSSAVEARRSSGGCAESIWQSSNTAPVQTAAAAFEPGAFCVSQSGSSAHAAACSSHAERRPRRASAGHASSPSLSSESAAPSDTSTLWATGALPNSCCCLSACQVRWRSSRWSTRSGVHPPS
mmetsp:Transcript_8164/g.24227  ORF Transcript_8164/g.24227 Transcript_8164/m.24227 type:complete len:235 (-) Transcript_8164:361-1065(-)